MCQGLRSPPAQAFELLKSFDASRLKVLLKVQVPYSLPAFFASARIALLESVLGALVAEWLATGRGLGQQMLLALANSNFSQLWAAAFAVTAASLVLYGLIGAVEVPVLSRFAPAQA